jgi:hypothetical protein
VTVRGDEGSALRERPSLAVAHSYHHDLVVGEKALCDGATECESVEHGAESLLVVH